MALKSKVTTSEVEGRTGESLPPASDDYDHVGGSNVDVSGSVTHDLEVPGRATAVAIRAENANDTFDVVVHQANTTQTYSGSSSQNIDEVRAVNSLNISVELKGAATSVDYDIYVR